VPPVPPRRCPCDFLGIRTRIACPGNEPIGTHEQRAQSKAILGAQKHPFARIDGQTVGWWRVVAASPSLKARVREIGDEAIEGLAVELAGPKADGRSRLVAGMIVLTWRTAYSEAIRVFERGGSAKKANAAFLALIDRGFAAVRGMAASSSQRPSVRG
jgi:hypothetical protein